MRLEYIRNIAIVGVVVIAVGAGGGGCSKKSKLASNLSSIATVSLPIEPGSAVGDVHKGMTLEEVTAKLGEPDQRATPYVFQYNQLGIAVMASMDGIVRTVMCESNDGKFGGRKSKTFAGRTKEGIGIGSSRSDITRAYGESKDAAPKPLPGRQPLAGQEVLVYKSLGLTFTLMDNKVCNLMIDFRAPGK